jgi:cytochrome c oxidase cbb3-type subunit III
MLSNLLRTTAQFSMMTLLAYAGLMGAPSRLQAQQAGKKPGESSAAQGKTTFVTICAACHGLDGGGAERGPDISHRREIQQLSDKALLKIVREGGPGTGMPPFGSLGESQVQAVVGYLRSLQGQSAAKIPGDPKHGKELFFGKAECSQCHMANGEGGFIASDLSSYAKAQSIDEIRSAITDPNKNLDPRRRTLIVTTQDGKTLTGIARNEDNFSLQLQTTDGTLHLLTKPELRNIEYQPRSLMPDDYGSRLSRQELDDLVSYLISIAQNKTKPASEQE